MWTIIGTHQCPSEVTLQKCLHITEGNTGSQEERTVEARTVPEACLCRQVLHIETRFLTNT